MTRLRQLMLEELERRNYAQTTIEGYIHAVEEFACYFHRSPDRLGPQHIREYQAYLFRQRKLAPSSVTQRLAALRFFFIKTLKRSWSVAETPYPKKVQHLPAVLSQEEVSQLINAAPTPFYRILLMTLYATGARRAEVARLKVSIPQQTSSKGTSGESGVALPRRESNSAHWHYAAPKKASFIPRARKPTKAGPLDFPERSPGVLMLRKESRDRNAAARVRKRQKKT